MQIDRRTLSLVAVCLTLVWGQPSSGEALERLAYNHPGLTVDLGVGLWAWPMPLDYDGDGDLDLIVSCPDKPYNGTYFFENPGTADTAGSETLPVFKPGVRIGRGHFNITPSYVNDQVQILVPGRELVNWRQRDFDASRPIHAKSNIHENKVRANQWRYVDYDGDSLQDLIVAVGDWTEYGWDNAFDDTGRWTRGPLHGYVYLLRNTGKGEPNYAAPVKLKAGGRAIDVFGMPSPNFADFDGDGDLDLICGEFLDGFTYFQNVGTRTEPDYAAGVRLPIRMDLQMIVPVAIDWDRDGDMDLIVGDEDGRVALVEHTGRVFDGTPEFAEPRYFQQEAADVKFGALVTPVTFDWDGDGDEDILAGNSAGYVGFIERVDDGEQPRWTAPVYLRADGKVIREQAGENGSIQGPAEAKWGYTTISVADWDHDGLPDLITNGIWGRVKWYRNVGTRTSPKLEPAKPVHVAWSGEPSKPAWNWWDPKPRSLVTQWRTTPFVTDLNRDGLNDLIMLDHAGYLAFFRRVRQGNDLTLLPGERIFTDSKGEPLRLNSREAGGSGRRKLCMTDWDGDGRLDLILNSRNAEWWRNVSTPDHSWAFSSPRPLHTHRLAGHTTSPTPVNWNDDSRPDLLIGGEDGHLYLLMNRPPTPVRAETETLKVEGYGFEMGTLNNGERAYTNRNYTWCDVPDAIRGWRCTRTAGGEPATITVTATRDTTVRLATAITLEGIDLTGWTKTDLVFGYTDHVRQRMHVFARSLEAGQTIQIPQGNWTGGVLLLPSASQAPAQ